MGDHHKQAFLAEWRALPHSCKEKQGLLSKFKLDKSCKWMVVHQETIEETNSSSLDTKDGYLNKFQLADLVKLPVESKEFEDFSTTLKSDHDWDEENPIERGFKKAGLARYHVEGFKDLKVENHTLKNSESLAATRQTTSTAGLGDALALQDKGQVQVKMENPLKQRLDQALQVLSSGKQAIEKVLPALEDLAACLLQKGKDPKKEWLKDKGETLQASVLSKLNQEVKSVRETLLAHKDLPADQCTAEQCRSIEDKSADLDVLLDAAKTWKKKAQLLTAEK
ncbi:unnamed protein product [Effrenium voratum]|uniref:Uncharacterized protein n=1 Tax=Effrenium voratum TaxID=2562239 RepID=A0AA36I763_9DINO|nr:unnamed protein product [Effrenium voratum]